MKRQIEVFGKVYDTHYYALSKTIVHLDGVGVHLNTLLNSYTIISVDKINEENYRYLLESKE